MKKEIINVHNLNFTYKDAKRRALNNVSFSVKENQWVSILGHNGSGKSTLSRLLNGLLIADEGSSITIDGLEMNDQNVWKIRDKIGIVFQNPDNQFVGASVQDDVAFGLENRSIPRQDMLKIVPQAIAAVGMENYLNTEPQLLSGGQKQRVAIAGIIAIKPKIIILDEATSMLDPEGRKQILALIRKLQKENNMTVLSITHSIDETGYADQILVLNDGELLAADTPEKIFSNVELIKQTGLTLPFIFQLKKQLNKSGLTIPPEIDDEEKLVKYLCQLDLKK